MNDDAIRVLLDAWELADADYDELPAQHGQHLRLVISENDRQKWYLQGRPAHISLEDWQFHAQLLTHHINLAPAIRPTSSGKLIHHSQDQDFIVQQWLPGQGFSQHHTAPCFIAAATTLGKCHRELAAINPAQLPQKFLSTTSNWRKYGQRLLALEAEMPQLFKKMYQCIEELANFDKIACHGDFYLHNLLWQGNEPCAIIDWEDAHLNVPAFDLAYLITHTAFLDWPSHQPGKYDAQVIEPDQQLIEQMIQAYQQETTLSLQGLSAAMAICWLVTSSFAVDKSVENTKAALQNLEFIMNNPSLDRP